MAKHKKRRLHGKANVTKEKSISKETSRKTQHNGKTSNPTTPFHPEDRILLVGEGDFSFAKSIVEHHGCYDVTATCFDSKDELLEKHKPQAGRNVMYLEDEGQNVLYHIDATKLGTTKALGKASLFQTIVFNFPHVGGKSKDVNRQVRFNQELLVKFFTAAIPLVEPSGTITVTLFEGEPYTLWNIRDLARHAGLDVQRSFKFQPSAYPGYSHSRTLGNVDGGGGWKGENRESRSYVFQKKTASGSSKSHSGVNKKRKRTGGDESSGDE